MRTVIYPYKMGSQSAKNLARELDALRVYPDRTYRPRETDLIINWGNSHNPNWLERIGGATFLNRPEHVRVASNKLRTFQALENAGISIPSFTTDREVALDYPTVYVRHDLNSHSGGGIEFIRNNIRGSCSSCGTSCASCVQTELPHAELYVKGIEARAEYRIHVFNGNVISYAKKRRERGDEPTEEQNKIRSHNNGWIFTRENLRRLERVEELAINAVRALNLDFGGVDIVRDEDGDVYVLEVNTACGLEGETLLSYVNAIREYGRN